MQRLVALAVLAAGLLASGTAHAAEQTVKLAVANMSCFSPLILRKSLSAVPGVTKVAVSFEQESAVVTFDDQKTNVQALIAKATNAGYPSKLTAASTAKTQ